MMIHICTTDSFFVDAPIIETKCLVCGEICNAEIGWIGERCSACGSVYSPFDDYASDIVRKRREKLGLTRRQIADKLGYKRTTIKNYEWVKPSKKYYEATLQLMKVGN